MAKNIVLIFSILFYHISCSDEEADPHSDFPEIDIPDYYGTYLYDDEDCSGSDIQYATLNENGITFFDFLGDNCDDTVQCYSEDIYELTEITSDTFLIITHDAEIFEDSNVEQIYKFESKEEGSKVIPL